MTDAGASAVLTELRGSVLTVTINRPNRLNAVTPETSLELADAIEAGSHDLSVRVIVLRGAGKAFCSGADITGGDELPPDPSVPFDASQRLITTITSATVPVVAVVHGPAAGVGAAIALAADITLASVSAYFLLAFTKIGLMPDGGATALVAASAGRATAMRLALLAQPLTAAEAARLGLIAGVADDLDAEVARVVDILAAGAPEALAWTKRDVNGATLDQLAASLAIEREGQLLLVDTDDFAEGMAAFAERRPPTFTGRPR